MENAPAPIRVEIYDQSYNLRGSDPDYIFKLAEYVDFKMRTLAQQTQTVDSLRPCRARARFWCGKSTAARTDCWRATRPRARRPWGFSTIKR